MAEIDYSCCERFPSEVAIFDASKIPGLATHLPRDFSTDKMTVVRPLSQFYGSVDYFDSRDAAIADFNKRIKEWCDSIPADSRLYWRRLIEIAHQRDFEFDCERWAVLCRVSAFPPRSMVANG